MDEVISAGDVGRFAYCALNWKRSKEGVKGAGGEAGLRRHEEVSENVDALELYQSRARFSIQSSFLLALFAISAASLALELLYLDAQQPWRLGLIVLSVAWLMGSLYLFLFDIFYRGQSELLVRRSKIVPGDVAYSESKNRSDTLRSRFVPLQGRPDYVIERGGHFIPVEVKSGKTPRRPFDSHVQQLAAYCYLVGEVKGVRPPYGVISYPETNFEVPFTRALEDEMLKNLLRIQLAQRTGEAHRSHEIPGRCAGCSRREGCPERLA